MISLFLKEIRAFFNSVTGYLVIIVFLLLNGVFLWLLPGSFNLLDAGYAGIDGLFMISPWVFMFLIPAITMRMFADEKRIGTMEFLLTKPLTELQIFSAKFLAALSLVLFSLLPTLLYYFSIHQLGEPVGNIDSGATAGSYIGLFLLGAAYISIGLFASSITDNPIISFILAALISFIFFFGFDAIAELDVFGSMDLLIYSLGINEHYLSISRGVVDSRDVLYFFGLIVVFAAMSRLIMQSRKWDKKSRMADFTQFGLILALAVMLNVVGAFKFARIDLTAEGRYSLNEVTLNLLDEIEDPMLFKVYLDGEFNFTGAADLLRLKKETRQMLEEFRAYNSNIEFEFIDPNEGDDSKELKQVLQSRGLSPYFIESQAEGGSVRLEVYPGALVSYGDKEIPINLLESRVGTNSASQVNASVQEMEYNLASGLKTLLTTNRPLIGFLQGHGELAARFVVSIATDLSESYDIDRFNIKEYPVDTVTGEVSLVDQINRMNRFDLLIVAKPEQPFNETDKFLIDNYIMNGGRIMWFIDPVAAAMDSLTRKREFLALPQMEKLNIDDMLFQYGVRLNTNLIQDYVCGYVNDMRSLRKWIYFPAITARVDHPITKDLNVLKLNMASEIDTVYSPNIKKTPLLVTSGNSRTQEVPGIVSLRTLYSDHVPEEFPSSNLLAGVLLEGHFTSIYKNRLKPRSLEAQNIRLRDSSEWTQQIVIADGDFIRNELSIGSRDRPAGSPLKLGFDQLTLHQYGNTEFILNAVDYMLDDSGLIDVRSTREIKMRLLNNAKVEDERLTWSILNTAVPVAFVLVFGVLYTWNRRRKYAVKA